MLKKGYELGGFSFSFIQSRLVPSFVIYQPEQPAPSDLGRGIKSSDSRSRTQIQASKSGAEMAKNQIAKGLR
jgi:hypothetical protein